MDQSLDKKLDLKEKINSFIKNHKLKFLLFISALLILAVIFFIIVENKKRKNILISEKYVRAGLLLSDNKKEEAKNYYEDIIISNNKFYSILALNTILEKDLITNKEKILKYFEILEKENYSEELNDLILFKKALYLLKTDNNKEGKKILNLLINKNSNFKSVALQVLK